MKENKRPAVGDSTTDRDLDDFVSKPGPSKKARSAKLLSEKQMLDLEIKKDPIVPNTEKRTVWALRTFTDWCDERNKCSAIQTKCP